MASSDSHAYDRWIMDFECSYHMCPKQKWFSSYREMDGGTVLMGNNHVCQVIEIGSIQIKMDDGVVKTLTDVRHIPALKRNLLSLSALDSNGCKFVGEGGVLK